MRGIDQLEGKIEWGHDLYGSFTGRSRSTISIQRIQSIGFQVRFLTPHIENVVCENLCSSESGSSCLFGM